MRRTLARTFILAIVATVAHAFNENGEANGKPSTIETLPPDPQGGGAEMARNDKNISIFLKITVLGELTTDFQGLQPPVTPSLEGVMTLQPQALA